MANRNDRPLRPTEVEISTALHDRALQVRAPADAPPVDQHAGVALGLPRAHGSTSALRALAAAALAVFVVGAVAVLGPTDHEVSVGGSVPLDARPTGATVPQAVGDLRPGQFFPGIPSWLVDFVASRGGIDAFPLVDGDRFHADSLGVVCPLPADPNRASPALNDAPSCTFVYRFASTTGDGEDSFDLCLRRIGDDSSACQSEDSTPGPTLVGDGVEYLYFRRNLDFDTAAVTVTGLGHDWQSFHVQQTEMLTWRLAEVASGE